MDSSSDLALVAHEMGGALAPARHALDVVRSGTAGSLAPDQERLLDIAARGLERAERVLQNLTAVALPQAYRLQHQDVDVRAMIVRLCDSFAADAQARGVFLTHEQHAEIVFPSDRFCVEQVLANLVSNAIKFTPAGGRVTVRALPPHAAVLPGRLSLLGGGFGRQPLFVVLEVSDTGVGVTEETRRRLFEPFYRGSEAQRCAAPGLGLGLTVARRLVQLLHGSLRLASEASRPGSRFVLTLPADAGTWELVERVDAALAALAPRLAAAAQSLAVLRHPDDVSAVLPGELGHDLESRLGETPCVLPLSRTTVVLFAPVPLRALVQALAAAIEARHGGAVRASMRMHAQQVARGDVADECLLQGLVRCRHALPAPRAVREVLGASNPARR